MLHPFTVRGLIVLALTAGMAGRVDAQALPDSLLKNFDAFRQHALQEKVYLHVDRDQYLTGETLWFKAYVTDGTLHKPLSMSKVLYIELIDRAQQPVLQTKVALSGGTGNGAFYLPATISSGTYQLRAYTRWMENFSGEFFYHRIVTIINPFRKIDKGYTAKPQPPDAQFFPEGGTLLAGVSCKVGFRVTNSAGNGIPFKGYLLNDRNDTVASFDPLHAGIGHFRFVPAAGQTYHALISDTSGKTTQHNFPAALSTGYALSVYDSSDNLVAIRTRASLPETDAPPLVYIIVHARQVVVAAEARFVHRGAALVLLNKRKLPAGISHITLFDAGMKPVCERLYFHRTQTTMPIAVRPDQPVYGDRRRVRVDVTSVPAANLSVSVNRSDSLSAPDGNIVDYFWLRSDLRGTIEAPAFYFQNDSVSTRAALDNLMLTHGWRRFQWGEALAGKKPPVKFLPEYRGHIVRGRVRNPDGNPAPGILAYLSAPGKIARLYGSRSNASGEVFFEMQKFHGSSSIVVQTNNKRDSLVRVEVQSPFSGQFTHSTLPVFSLSPAVKNSLLERSVAMQVQDVYYQALTEKTNQASVDSTAFYGIPDEKYYLDAFTRFPVMEEVMREYVPGVLVRKRRDGFHFLVLDMVHRTVFDETPLVMLDGIPIFDEDEIMAFDPLKIQKLEVVTKRYYLGPLSFPGIVSYTTYAGDLGGFQLHPKSVKLDYEGLQLQREFYSPLYENAKQRESRMPDRRTLLYWNPAVIAGSDGRKQVEFYTSDMPGEYTITVEGIAPDGQVGHVTQTFSVSEPNN